MQKYNRSNSSPNPSLGHEIVDQAKQQQQKQTQPHQQPQQYSSGFSGPASSSFQQQYHQQQFFQRPGGELKRSHTSSKAETLKSMSSQHSQRSPTNTLPSGVRSSTSTIQRVPSSDNAYSPVRTPSTSQRLTRSRTSSNGAKYPQHAAQERTYLRKIKNDMVNDYYTKAIISDPTDEESEEEYFEDEDEWSELPLDRDTFKDSNLEIETNLDASILENGASNSGVLERLEWNTMLGLVLHGDVISSEKRRIITQHDFSAQTTYKENLWLGIKAYTLGRSEEQQRRIIGYSRSLADDFFKEVLNFKVKNEEKALEEVQDLLTRYDSFKSLWRNEREMAHEKPVCASEEFTQRVEALISWKNITKSFVRDISILQKWTESQTLELTVTHNDGFVVTTFAERMLKEKDIALIFNKRLFSPHTPWINKSKAAYLQYHEIFTELNLPSFIPSLTKILHFPLRLIEEIIRVRLAYAKKLTNPTMMMIDEMIDDFSSYIELAVVIKQCGQEYRKGWDFQFDEVDGFEKSVLDSIKYLFMLLHKKFINTTSKTFKTFKEPDDLEQYWSLLKNVGCFIDGAGPEVASQITSLTTRLISRLVSYVQDQERVVSSISTNNKLTPSQRSQEITNWVSDAIDTFSTIRRKLEKFTFTIKRAFSNSCLYQISKFKAFLEVLRDSNHFLVKTGHSSGTYILASRDLYGREEDILKILKGTEIGCDSYIPRPTMIDIDEYEEETESGYVVVINASKAVLWDGLIVSTDSIREINFDIKPGEVLMINQGSSQTLKQSKQFFTEVIGDTLTFVEQRCSLHKVQRDLIRAERLSFRIVNELMDTSQRCILIMKSVKKTHDGIYMSYCLSRDLGKHFVRNTDTIRKQHIVKKMMRMSIDWVSYIVDDCVPTDKKTFRWCVAALEFAMEVSKGFNILTLSDTEFKVLKEKVAGCMSLLISHFDIMGARSSIEAEKKHLNPVIQPSAFQTDTALLEAFSQQRMREIEKLERRLTSQPLGKVLDDTQTENQFLSFLASSFSSLSMRWQKRKFIGGGSFGSVFSALNLDTGGVLAVKEIRFQDSQSIKQIVPTIKDEMTVLEMLNHPNIVQYYGVEVHRDKVNIFMEYCEGGSLASLLEHGRIEDEMVIQMYTLQMFEGLAYLHDMKIVHRDIKPENILLDHSGIIKFVDFGAAKVAKNLTRKPSTKVNSMTGTPMYMSPEAITGGNSSRFGAIDVWSTGCCVLEMCTGRRPWANLDNEWAIMYHIAAGHMPQFPTKDQLSEMGFHFLHQCLQQDPNKRATAAELLQDPWMLDIRAKAFSDGTSSSASDELRELI